jgi:hypothetical protein
VIRRFLVIAALMFWQGGFTFYAAIVVPIGTEVLGSAAEQALITRRVTWQINMTGAVALAIFAWDTFATRHGRRLSPSPLAGEGWGGGYDVSATATPHPNPPPQGGREQESRRRNTKCTLGRALAWLVMAAALVVLVVLRGHLDEMFIPDQLKVVDRPAFHFWHRTYLWVSTVQWAAAIVFTLLSLAAWRAQDAKPLAA